MRQSPRGGELVLLEDMGKGEFIRIPRMIPRLDDDTYIYVLTTSCYIIEGTVSSESFIYYIYIHIQ